MTRPRSILGLLGLLLAEQVRRRPGLCAAGAAAVLATAAATGGPAAAVPVQAAVLADGFVVMHGEAGSRRVVALDAGGARRFDAPFVVRADARVAGSRVGPIVGWHDGRKVRLARVGADGELGDDTTWGKSATKLCAGQASNDERFAIGWLEEDGAVWFVHGPVAARSAAAAEVPIEIHDPSRASWCAVASAEKNVALLWRSKRYWNTVLCSARGCDGIPARLDLEPEREVLAFGCLQAGCMIASRGPTGPVRLDRFSARGKLQRSRPLADDVATVAIVGVGDRGFAVATGGPGEAAVHRFAFDGATTELWRRADAGAPAIAWSKGQLVVGYTRGGAVASEVLALPR